jgi:hypothetical protein
VLPVINPFPASTDRVRPFAAAACSLSHACTHSEQPVSACRSAHKNYLLRAVQPHVHTAIVSYTTGVACEPSGCTNPAA